MPLPSAASALPTESGIFDTIAGLPVHPLAVHAAVVLLPLSALGLVAIVVVPGWRSRFGWLVMGGLVVGAGTSFVAKESGEALATHVGLPVDHAAWGDRLPIVAFLLLVAAFVWFFQTRRHAAPVSSGTKAVGAVAALLALAATGITVLVGHSGATAVWSGRIQAAGQSTTIPMSGAAPTARPSSTATAGSGQAAGSGYTMAQVARHNSAASCWTVIEGVVYDLTPWPNQHPGGAQVILGMCGQDGTSAFTAQHGGQRRPTGELAQFKLGPLG